jgi:Na+/H+ antiporter NhaD/arsenite permease-like protein
MFAPFLLFGGTAHGAPDLPGAAMGWGWAIPFAGVLLSIALGPLLASGIWHAHYGKIGAAWAASALFALFLAFGWEAAVGAFAHALLAEYLSFIVLLFALYVVAGGVLVTGNLEGTPRTNTAILALGACMASIVGTTGAAMILIRPLIRANRERRHNVHVVVFFILLVANIGGALTPLGDPPLFVGFLRGVDFFWTAEHLWPQTAIAALIVIAVFAVLDSVLYRREGGVSRKPRSSRLELSVRGGVNFLLILAIVAVIVAASNWEPGVAFDIFGAELPLQGIVRDGALLLIALTSLWLTQSEHREENGFTWEPIREVAILFAAIFIAIIPVIAMLSAGRDGAFAPLLALVTETDGRPREVAYFWLTGGLSAFLDNAPTYLVFFELAGGDAEELMGPSAGTLAAISMGAVFMGALSYLGNAPNLMIYAIAVERGVRMPGFFAYLGWASLVLIPIFVLLTVLPLAPVIDRG